MSYLPLALIVLVWAAVLAFVWFAPVPDLTDAREREFWEWKIRRGTPNASFAEFIGSEQAPRTYMTRLEKTAAATAVALLALWGAFR
jgi:hypothetical protein